MATDGQESSTADDYHRAIHSGKRMEGDPFAAAVLVYRVADSASGCTQYCAAGVGESTREADIAA